MANIKQIPNDREAAILSVLVRGELHGRDIRNQYEARTGDLMPVGSLYTTLERMVEKGFVASREGGSAPGRGGNKRRYFKLTGSGLNGLNLWQQIVSMPSTGVTNA